MKVINTVFTFRGNGDVLQPSRVRFDENCLTIFESCRARVGFRPPRPGMPTMTPNPPTLAPVALDIPLPPAPATADLFIISKEF